jgi:hypothetical protein
MILVVKTMTGCIQVLGCCFVFCAGPPGSTQKTKQKHNKINYFLVAGTRAQLRDHMAPPIPMILAVKQSFLEIPRPRARERARSRTRSRARARARAKRRKGKRLALRG